MLIIHIDSKSDTALLKSVYAGLNCQVLYNPSSRQQVIDAICREPELVIFLGHGSPHGLFCLDFSGYIFDAQMAHLLQGKRCVGIWCYAAEFAKACGLSGFFTSMFISNENEAHMFGYHASNADVFAEVEHFVSNVHTLLRAGISLADWPQRLRDAAHLEKDFVRFNYSLIAYLE